LGRDLINRARPRDAFRSTAPDPDARSDQPRPTLGRGERALRSCGAALYVVPQLSSRDIARPPGAPAAAPVPSGPAAAAVPGGPAASAVPGGPAASRVPCGPAASAVGRRAARVSGRAEALVAAGVLGGGGAAGRDRVASAVGAVAQVGAAAHDPHMAGERG